jgi:hypothetical protein
MNRLAKATWLPLAAIVAAAAPAHAASDPYAPLKVLEGRWTLTFQDGQKLILANQCAKLARAFTCEQTIEGSAANLEVYLPIPNTAGGYKTLALDYSAPTPAPWSRLTIDGPHWIYQSNTIVDGHVVYRRTTNEFDGPNRIRFLQERSADEKTWETVASGEETRIR